MYFKLNYKSKAGSSFEIILTYTGSKLKIFKYYVLMQGFNYSYTMLYHEIQNNGSQSKNISRVT